MYAIRSYYEKRGPARVGSDDEFYGARHDARRLPPRCGLLQADPLSGGIDGDDIVGQERVTDIRITSYNVCYTKLLREARVSRAPAHE